MQLRLAVTLGARDLLYERTAFLTQVLALGAVLAPLLILHSLRYGVVEGLLSDLAAAPENRLIAVSPASGARGYDSELLEWLAELPQTGFIAPNIAPIAKDVRVITPDTTLARTARATVLATGTGDPMLPAGLAPPGRDEAVISQALARRLGLAAGDAIAIRLERTLTDGGPETLRHRMTITGILDPAIWPRPGLLVSLDVLTAIGQWQDFRAVPDFGWGGPQPPDTPVYYNFRLYASDLPSIRPLLQRLQERGIDARAPRLAEYESIAALNRSLGLVFLVVALAGGTGYAAAFAANLWAGVERKRRDLSLLRLLGLARLQTAAFPLVQATIIAVAGWAVASALFALASWQINTRLGIGLPVDSPAISLLTPAHLLFALGLTLVTALVAALVAARRVTAIDPAEGVRHV